jgi:hypothetical protein
MQLAAANWARRVTATFQHAEIRLRLQRGCHILVGVLAMRRPRGGGALLNRRHNFTDYVIGVLARAVV